MKRTSLYWPCLQPGPGSHSRWALVAVCFFALANPAYAVVDASLPIAGEEVGSANPVGAADTNMFRDDELNLWGAMRGYPEVRFFPGAPTNDALTAWSFNLDAAPVSLGLPQGWFLHREPVWRSDGQTDYAWPLVAMASGRVSDTLRDQVVMVGTDEFAGKVDVVLRAASATSAVQDAAQLSAVASPGKTIGVDVAVGDLDRIVDESGYFHDEIVVLWGPVGTDCRVRIDVLDYSLSVLASATITGCTGRVAAVIGDFNADGNLELAAVTNDETTLRAQACALISDSPEEWHLSCLPEFAVQNADKFPFLDATTGNVLGLGKEEIVLVTSPSVASSTNYFNVVILGLDAAEAYTVLDVYGSLRSSDSRVGGAASIQGVHEVRAATGLFQYDPARGYDFGNRQLVTAALGGSSTSQTADLWFWEFDGPDDPGRVFAKAHTSTPGKHTARPSLAVGNFVGHGVSGDQNQPTMQAALTYLFTTADNINDPDSTTQRSAVWNLSPPDSDSTTWTTELTWSSSFYPYFATWSYDPFILAVDDDGDSWRLGIPIHIAVSADVKYNSLLEEPPKHVDYLPIDPDDLSKGFDVVNISGYKTFYVGLKQSGTESISTQKTDTTDWSVGGGADLSGDFQVNLGRAKNPKVRLDVNGELKVDGSYEESTEDVNSHYLSKSVTWTNSTEADDEIDVSIQDLDIWRYPIIGFETDDPDNPQGYYEILMPGQSYGSQTGGKQFDWYAPLHVNNNILSYPQTPTSQGTWLPSDVGSFEVPELDNQGLPILDDDGNPVMKTVTGELMAEEIVYTWDGNRHSLEMQFSKTDQTSHQTNFSSTLTGSADIGVGFSSRTKVPLPDVPLSFSLDVKGDFSANGKYSWGGGTLGSMQMSKSSGVTLEIPAIIGFSQEDRSYSFTSAVYASTSQGGLKVAHSVVGLIDHPQDWWVKQYGRAPDPALNLPFRFRQRDPDPQHSNLNWWELKTAENDFDDTRHQMRGFFMRYNEIDQVTGEYELFAGAPVDGEIVRLCARVHNFSLGQATGDFDADFYYYAWNTQTGKAVDRQTGEEVYELVWIGSTRVASLDRLSNPYGVNMREVCVPWDTTNLSQVADPNIGYRLLVNLDETDEIKGEIHELKDSQGNEAPGGNNSGRWPWSGAIMISSDEEPTPAAPGLELVDGALEESSLDVSFRLSEGGIEIQTAAGFLEGEPLILGAGEPSLLRAHIVSESSYSGHVWVAFFDGNPRQGGKLIALEHQRGLRQGDNYVWARWTPETAGEHEVRAFAFHRLSHANREGGTTSRPVTVASAPDAGGGDDDGCATATRRNGSISGPAALVLVGFAWLVATAFSRRRTARQGLLRPR
jgi:hypothetical protein